jgi:hypothetical protein
LLGIAEQSLRYSRLSSDEENSTFSRRIGQEILKHIRGQRAV